MHVKSNPILHRAAYRKSNGVFDNLINYLKLMNLLDIKILRLFDNNKWNFLSTWVPKNLGKT